MILGVGCDIIRVARVARAAEKEHFLTRVYTPAERAYAMQRGAG
ncbi:MAG: 4-phosphopantetheinyl transferase, partial [Selenomonas sp.]|nr:4-phosphopantetheinyl transferase [Selenomonas sp.]